MSLDRAKTLRKQMTDAERRLWYHLRGHRFRGFKFKRQAPLGNYVVDFVSYRHNLIVEVDGGPHADSLADKRRDEWLRNEGIRVLRFWNNDVLRNTAGVLEQINSALEDQVVKPPSPALLTLHARSAPSPTRGEGKTESSR